MSRATPASAGNWYFGWNIVAASTLLTLLTVGMRMGIGPFFLPIATGLGFSRSLLASIVAVGMLFYGLGMPLAGYLVARRGTKFVLLTGTVIVVASSIWSVFATSPLTFLLSFGVLLSTGLAFTSPVALTPVISRWFTRQRGMALFFLSTGSMAGIAVMTPVLTLAIESVTDAIRTAPFWKICAGLFACGFSMHLLGTHGMPMLMDHGFDAMTSSYGIGLIGLVAIFGTLIMGRLADRLPRRNILAAIYFIRGLGFLALLVVGTHYELYIAASIGGLVWAGSIALSSAILADLYGVRLVGILYGWAYLSHQIGATFSSWLGGWGYEAFGTHWIAFGLSAALLFGATAISLKLPQKGYALPSSA